MATELNAVREAMLHAHDVLHNARSMLPESDAGHAEIGEAMRGLRDAAALAAPPVEQQAAALMAPEALRNTIGTLLEDAMNVAVKNGANSVSMPDEYVALAVWLCEQPAPQALNATDSERAAMAKTMTAAPAAEPVVWLNPATLETIPHDSKRVFEACPAGSVAALKAGMFTEPLYAAPPPAEPAPQAVHGFPADEFQAACDAINDANGVPRRTVSTQPAPQAGAALVEAVAKAIMFEDCGSTESWAENTNLAEAAIRVCDARNPPRCSHCHSATSAPVHPTEQPSQDAALVAMAEAWELCAADLQEYEEDAAADAWRKAARDLRQHAARAAQAQGEKGGQA